MNCAVEGDSVVFSVHNPAVMPRDVQLQMFQRSFSTKGSGRGLGTYSIKLLTERYLRGSVRFESRRDYGTTFYVRYPLVWE
jgi:sensor histidine kinase regulating citrate/malate metabolism